MSETVPEAIELVREAPVQDVGIVLMPVMNIAAAKARLKEFQEFVREYLVEGEDFGTIPGTPKPTLLKPGADKLCELYGLADKYVIKEVENWQLEPPLFDYTVTCTLVSRRNDGLVGSGVGSCNSWEGKYKYREATRKCPLCGGAFIIKGKEEYGGGWLCFKKKGGCGAKFSDTDKAITDQKAGKEVNDDVPTLKNTILKMAKKRAKIDAVIAVTRSSGIFTQDMEDIAVEHGPETGQGTHAAAQRVAEQKINEAKAKKGKKDVLSGANGQEKPSGEVTTLFYVAPPEHNGNRYEFVNLKEYGSSLNEIAQEGLRQVILEYASTGKQGLYVPYDKMAPLLDELERLEVPTKELKGR